MTLTIIFKNSNSCNFRKKNYLFSKHWEIVNKRGAEYSGLEVTVATSFIFDILRAEWVKNGWDVEELKYLCLAMDNPNNFIYCQAAYLDDLKNYYQQNRGRVFVIWIFRKRRIYKRKRFTKSNKLYMWSFDFLVA